MTARDAYRNLKGKYAERFIFSHSNFIDRYNDVTNAKKLHLINQLGFRRMGIGLLPDQYANPSTLHPEPAKVT